MTSDIALWLTLFSLLATCLASIGAKSLREFSRHDLAEICEKRGRRHLLSEILLRHDQVALGVECFKALTTSVFVCSGAYWAWLEIGADADPQTHWAWFALGAIAGWISLAAIEVWLPWAITRLWAEPFLVRTWRLWRLVGALMRPLVWCARFVDAVLHRLAGRQPEAPTEESIEDEIRTIVTEGHREGLLEEDAREMIEGVIELGDADVSEIMTPRTDMVCMHIGLSWPEMIKFVNSVGHTRIPVYDKNRDDIVGLIYYKDLLPELSKDPGVPKRAIADLLRKPYFVPETKPVDVLLQEFQATRSHMAVVLDEYGGVSGLVTIEDVLEEIVGEIVDEYDDDLVEGIKPINAHTFEALARVHIDEINEHMHIELPDDGEFDTIGGFVFHALGRIPTRGEEVLWGNVRITVLEASRRRIDRVRLEVIDAPRRESA